MRGFSGPGRLFLSSGLLSGVLSLFKAQFHICHVAEINKLLRGLLLYSGRGSSFDQPFPEQFFVRRKRDRIICIFRQCSPALRIQKKMIPFQRPISGPNGRYERFSVLSPGFQCSLPGESIFGSGRESQKKKISSNCFSSAMHRTSASFAVGLNCPVSIELIVFRDTPTISASCACDSPFSERISLSLFFSISLSFI